MACHLSGFSSRIFFPCACLINSLGDPFCLPKGCYNYLFFSLGFIVVFVLNLAGNCISKMSQDVGGMPPPEGVTPDFDGSSPLQKSIVVIYSCTFAVATILLMLRLYTGIVIVRKLDWDIRKLS